MLARFERLVEQAVEGSLRRVFPAPLQPVQLAKAAARAMEQAQIVGVRGPEAPNEYELLLAADDLERFGEYRDALAQQVADYLVDYADERGLRLVAAPHVQLIADGSTGTGKVRATARFANLAPSVQRVVDSAAQDTRQLRLGELAAATNTAHRPAMPPGGLLLTDHAGLHFALEPSLEIVRLGRAADNDVVIASRRVSRYHAQLRRVESSWLVYDLHSTNGTWVGDERVLPRRPAVLAPGARVRLGDHDLTVDVERPVKRGPC